VTESATTTRAPGASGPPAEAKATLSGDVVLPDSVLRSSNVRKTLSGDRRDLETGTGLRPAAKPEAVKGTLSGDDPAEVIGEGAVRGTLSGDDVRGTLSGDGPDGARRTLSGGGSTLSGEGASSPEYEPGAESMAEGLSAFDYDVKAQLGRGGMGIVWTATQRSLRRPVAVKTLRPELVGGPAGAKFAAEAFVTGRLEHPNIPPVHAYGHDDVGRPYLTMKLVKGVEWGRLLEPVKPEEKARAAKMTLRDHLEIIRKVCEAVAFAHAHGVLHRDLKPENVMVGEFGEVLVMDWGIALDLAARVPHDASGAGGPRRPIGTPAYLPPEMALADEARQGPWTDVYLIGGMLYELLTGATPHKGESILAVLLAAQKGEIEPPHLRALDREVPERLGEIAMRCLDKEETKRYASAREVEDAIEEYLANEASLKLSAAALADLAAAEQAIIERTATQSATYATLASVVADLRQAVKLWEGNRAAKEGLVKARLRYALYALAQGDLGLAEAQLEQVPAGEPTATPIRVKAMEVRRARAAEAERRKRTRVLLLALVVAILGLGVWIIREVRRADKSEKAMAQRAKAQEITQGVIYNAPPERIAIYRSALEIDPTWPEGWSDLGRAYSELAYDYFLTDPVRSTESLALAIQAMEKAGALDPTNVTTIADRAYLHEMAGEFGAAERDFLAAAKLEPTSHAGWEAATVLAFLEERFPDAVTAASKAIEVEPGETDYFRRAVARFILGDLDAALADVKKAEKLSSRGEDEWYHALMVMIYLAKGEERDAGERILRGLRYHARGPHLLPLAALHAARMGDRERAHALLARAREEQAAYAKCYLAQVPTWRAAKLAKKPFDIVGRAYCMEVDLDSVLPKEAPRALVLRRRGEERYARGEYELAISDAERALGDDPADGNARLLRGRCFVQLGHVDQGRADLRHVGRLAPNRAEDLAVAMKELEAAEAQERAGEHRPLEK